MTTKTVIIETARREVDGTRCDLLKVGTIKDDKWVIRIVGANGVMGARWEFSTELQGYKQYISTLFTYGFASK